MRCHFRLYLLDAVGNAVMDDGDDDHDEHDVKDGRDRSAVNNIRACH